jgi:hypothetical protein
MRGEHIVYDKYVAFVVVETNSGISVAGPSVLYNVVGNEFTITKIDIIRQFFLGEQLPLAFLRIS